MPIKIHRVQTSEAFFAFNGQQLLLVKRFACRIDVPFCMHNGKIIFHCVNKMLIKPHRKCNFSVWQKFFRTFYKFDVIPSTNADFNAKQPLITRVIYFHKIGEEKVQNINRLPKINTDAR